MNTYSQFRPTQFDTRGLGLSDRQDWLVAPVIRTRDSDPLAQSNFETFLSDLGGESDSVELHSFNHWGPGWFEIILIDPKNVEIVEKAEELESTLENYPVLDESDLSERELKLSEEDWDLYGRKDFYRGFSKLFKDLEGESEHGFTMEEIVDNLDLLTDDQIDSIWYNSTKELGWITQTEGNSTVFNDKKALKRVNPWELVDFVDSALWDKKTRDDIKKLCLFLGLPQLVEVAIEKRLTLVSQIKQLSIA